VRLEHSFEVPAPIERAWEALLDIERVAPCMPGATLTEHDGDDFAGTVKVKLGPVNLTYKGKGRFVDIDEAARRVVITASGADTRGAGTASASVTAVLVVAAEARTRVDVVTDLDVTGKAVQFGRGLIGDVSTRLIGQFADCLAEKLAEQPAGEEPAGGPEPPAEEPIDLLALTGAGPALRHALPYVVTALLGLLVLRGLIRRARRRAR